MVCQVLGGPAVDEPGWTDQAGSGWTDPGSWVLGWTDQAVPALAFSSVCLDPAATTGNEYIASLSMQG